MRFRACRVSVLAAAIALIAGGQAMAQLPRPLKKPAEGAAGAARDPAPAAPTAPKEKDAVKDKEAPREKDAVNEKDAPKERDATKETRDSTKEKAADVDKKTRDTAKDAEKTARDTQDAAKHDRKPAEESRTSRTEGGSDRDGAKGEKSSERQGKQVKTSDLGFTFSDKESKHLTISDLTKESFGARAGLREHDQILSINDHSIETQRDFLRWIRPGSGRDRIAILVLRDGRRRTVYFEPREMTEFFVDNDAHPYLGVVLDPHVRNAAVISRVNEDSPAKAAGLQAGDVILALDGEQIRSANQLGEVIAQMEPGNEVAVTIDRNKRTMDMDVVLGAH